jgi:sulfur relay (sulfurtransferase) complex TusBCD TusD component (DsrE family)
VQGKNGPTPSEKLGRASISRKRKLVIRLRGFAEHEVGEIRTASRLTHAIACPTLGPMSDLRGKKLGILVSCLPEQPNFQHALQLAQAAVRQGLSVYLYCIDDAVKGVESADMQALKAQGLKLYACAYGANHRNYPTSEKAVFAGLTVVNDIIAGTDRFVSFN